MCLYGQISKYSLLLGTEVLRHIRRDDKGLEGPGMVVRAFNPSRRQKHVKASQSCIVRCWLRKARVWRKDHPGQSLTSKMGLDSNETLRCNFYPIKKHGGKE